MKTPLINRAQVKQFALEIAGKRAHRFTRVGNDFFLRCEAHTKEFRPRTAWSLFNAFTEAFKEINPHTAIARGEALHGLFDGAVALAS
ncbi:MAG: hypothetical protein NTV93_10490 [Verrucomicrobia bacterium]|nr:hypothetical protein [Verrucomicrobiota bacterium]